MRPCPSISPLSGHLGFWLRYVSNHVSLGFARKVEAEGVTVAEWVVLRTLYDVEAMTPSRLAEAIGMTRGAVSKLADRLRAKRLIERREIEGDGRSHQLALSAAGAALTPKLAALADRNDAEFFAHLSSEERARIEMVLRDIVRRRGLSTLPTE